MHRRTDTSHKKMGGGPTLLAVLLLPGLLAAGNSPNALRPGTFRYVAGHGLYVSAGRVRRLLDEASMAPGLHTITFDGRGDQGERLTDGVYFYRVQAAERTATGRFVIVR